MSADCPICLEQITTINCTTTECGHTFHSCCIFKNLTQNNGCPLCRKELVEVIESDEDNESYNSDDESYNSDEDDEGVESQSISVFQYTEALKRKGAIIVQIGEVPLFSREGFRVSWFETRLFI